MIIQLTFLVNCYLKINLLKIKMETCTYCENIFSNKSNLTKHQKTSKKCISIQKEQDNPDIIIITYKCKFCKKDLSSNQKLNNHLNICKEKIRNEKQPEKDIEKQIEQQVEKRLQQLEINKETIKPTIKQKIVEEVEVETKIPEETNIDINENIAKEIKPKDTILSNMLFKSELTNEKEIRVVGTSENPLFIGKDIAEILGYADTKKAIEDHIDEEDKMKWKQAQKSKGGEMTPLKLHPQTILINESGLYSLILRSKLEGAKKFKRWITSEVLPSIRKAGSYKLEQDFNKLSDDYKLLQKNHNNILKRRHRVDFDCGNVIYIVSHEAFNVCYNTTFFKIGKTSQKKGETISCFKDRLSSYNTCAPVDFKVHYLLYVEENDLIEKNAMLSYIDKLDPSNKEWIKDVKLEEIIGFLRQLCVLLKIDHKEVVFENQNRKEVIENIVSDAESEVIYYSDS